jgi:hypothetical protein
VTRRCYSSAELALKVRETRAHVDAAEFFSSPRFKKTQELWCAAHFCAGLEVVSGPYRIWASEADEQTDVDFELEVAQTRLPFQITEVQTPGRRRGDEYRGRSEGPWTDEDRDRGTVEGAEWIRAAIAKKAARYSRPEDLNLLVYVNFPAWDQEYPDLAVRTTTEASRFASCWLLNGNTLCHMKSHSALPEMNGWLVIPESPTLSEA